MGKRWKVRLRMAGLGSRSHLAGASGGWHRGKRIRRHRAGIPLLPRVRHPRSWFRPCPLRRLRARLPGRLLLQVPRRLPFPHYPPHGRDGGASGRPRHPAFAGAPVGALMKPLRSRAVEQKSLSSPLRILSQAPALSPGARSGGSERRTAYIPDRHRAGIATPQSRRQCSVPPRRRDLHPPFRGVAQHASAFSLHRGGWRF